MSLNLLGEKVLFFWRSIIQSISFCRRESASLAVGYYHLVTNESNGGRLLVLWYISTNGRSFQVSWEWLFIRCVSVIVVNVVILLLLPDVRTRYHEQLVRKLRRPSSSSDEFSCEENIVFYFLSVRIPRVSRTSSSAQAIASDNSTLASTPPSPSHLAPAPLPLFRGCALSYFLVGPF